MSIIPERGILAVVNPKNIASKEVHKQRYEICMNCDKLDKSIKQCTICLCFVGLKTKIIKEECPKNYW